MWRTSLELVSPAAKKGRVSRGIGAQGEPRGPGAVPVSVGGAVSVDVAGSVVGLVGSVPGPVVSVSVSSVPGPVSAAGGW